MSHTGITIETQVDEAYAGRVGPEPLVRAASATLQHQGVAGPADLTIVVTGDAQLRRLNRQFRGVDAPTDVLSFAEAAAEPFVSPPGMPRYLGDVLLSFERASEQAQRAGHPVEAELQLLTVHGVLHLLGHDHAAEEDRAVMWAAQAAILAEVGAAVVDPTPE